MRKQLRSQSAWVLTTRSYRDTSLIADCFTLNHGRISIIAKGAKQNRSRFRGLLQLFSGLKLSWIEGNSDLFTLTEIDELPQRSAKLSGTALYCGFYINELMSRLLYSHDPHPLLFEVYSRTLELLSSAEEDDLKQILRVFEKRMLQSIGYGLMLTKDSESGIEINPDSVYKYIPELGPVEVMSFDMGFKLHGSTLLSLEAEQEMDSNGDRESRTLMRNILKFYLGEKPLKSRELLHNDF